MCFSLRNPCNLTKKISCSEEYRPLCHICPVFSNAKAHRALMQARTCNAFLPKPVVSVIGLLHLQSENMLFIVLEVFQTSYFLVREHTLPPVQ